MLFPEALPELSHYEHFTKAFPETPGKHHSAPLRSHSTWELTPNNVIYLLIVLANMTEFGKSRLFTTEELGSAGVSIALYPLSAFRAMSSAALKVYQTIMQEVR